MQKMISKYGFENIFTIEGVWWRPAFGVKKGVNKNYLNILRRNLVKNRILIGNSFNFCFSHTSNEIYKELITKIDKAFKITKLDKIRKRYYLGNNVRP